MSKNSKIITCVLLAVCILATMFTSASFSIFANDDTDKTKTAVFIGKSGSNAVANTFIPIDIPQSGTINEDVAKTANLYTGDTYFKLTFECKMLSGTKPIIGIMGVSSTDSNRDCTYSKPSWCDNAADVTVADGVCTAYFKVDFSHRFNEGGFGWRSFYITIGNAEHDGSGVSESDFDVSFIMSDVKLVTCDALHNVTDTTNRLPGISSENINFGGTYFYRSDGCSQWDSPYGSAAMQWHVDSSPVLVKEISVPVGYNTSADYDAANFTKHGETANLREYYTNSKYGDMYFEKLKNSNDKGFAIISDDLNKKFLYIEANHQGEPDNTTVDGYKPAKNKVGNIFLPITLGQYVLNGGATENQKVLLKVTFNATRIEGDASPVLGRIVGMKTGTEGKGSRAWGLSTVNVRGSAYYTNYNRSDNGGGVRPQCTYDAETGEFVGWVGMETANNDLATCWGIHEVLTIGNAEHVYQASTFDSTSFNSSFAIKDIKVDLYSTTISGNDITPKDLIAEDIAPAFTADTVDTEGAWSYNHVEGKSYSNHDNDLIRASQNSWHIDGEHSLVSFINMEDIKGYAKKYSLTEEGGKGVLSTFIKLESGKTYQYVFKSKYESDAKAKPFVEFTTKSGVKKVDTSNYKSDKDDFYNTVFVFKTPDNLANDKNVRIGIDFTSADISGTFGGFEIYEVGEDGMSKTEKNLIKTVFLGENATVVPYSAGENIGVWMKDGTLGNGSTTFTLSYKEDSFYAIPSEPQMLIFSGVNKNPTDDTSDYSNGDGKLTQSLRIETGRKYRFSANVKYAGTGMENDTVGFSLVYFNKAGTTKTLSDYTDLSDENKYLLKYEFDAPASLIKSGSSFKVTFNAPNGFVSGYLANVSLTEIDADGNEISDNLIDNGNFATGDDTGWTKSGSFYVYKFCDIPENFFSKNPPNNLHALRYRDTGDYQLLQQMVSGIKPNTKYELTYTSLVTGYDSSEPYGIVYQKLWNSDKTESSWTYMLDNEKNAELADPTVITTKQVLNEDKLKKAMGSNYDSSEVKDQSILVKKVFTTSESIRVGTDCNLSVRFYFMTASSGYISNYTLYELDEMGNRKGNNLILDGDFSSGFEVFSGNPGTNATPWNYTNDGVVRNIKLENGFFENHTVSETMIRSDGSAANQTYGNQLFVNPNSRYYFSGHYVKTNFEGLTPEVLYRSVSANGEYVSLPFEQYFDSIRYYFETEGGFTIPDDAVINSEGKADIIVRLSNRDHGKGYFCSLSLTQDNSSVNLFDDRKATLGKFISMEYDPEIFMPFEGDEGFEDGNWSGETVEEIKTGAILGTVIDEEEYTLSEITMKLAPGNKKTVTDDYGEYGFEDLEPGNYKLYLVESSGEELFCTDITVKAGILTTLPDIVYHEGSVQETTVYEEGTENGEKANEDEEYEDEEEEEEEEQESTNKNRKRIIRKRIIKKNKTNEKSNEDSGNIDSNVDDIIDDVDLDDDYDEIDDAEDVIGQKYGALKGYCYDSSGKLLSGIDIYVNSKSHHTKTNSKGVFKFDRIPPGEYKICTILDDGSVYVFRTVKIEAGQGKVIRVMMPDTESLPTWALILIIAGGVCLLGAGALVTILLILKKKRAAAL